jgi:hypothetical protein
MDSNEFWCRAFLTTMAPVFQACIGTGAEESNVAAQCADMADAALAVAQRRGMVTAGDHLRRVTCAELQDGITWERDPEQAPQGERVEVWPVDFTATRDGDLWTLHGWELGGAGIQVLAGRESYPMGAAVVHIKWCESCPPKPIKVWLERAKGGA